MTHREPTLAERSAPGLSAALTGPRDRQHCQSCSGEGLLHAFEMISARDADKLALLLWMECDEWDRDQPVFVVLCAPCSKRLVNPHPRLYKPVDPWTPALGILGICEGCTHYAALTCRSPLARYNGGPGLDFEFPKPTHMHVQRMCNGRRVGEWRQEFHGPVTRCSGRESAE